MSDQNNRVQEIVDGIAASVGVVELSDEGDLLITACNDSFFAMCGGRQGHAYEFPFFLDSLLPSYARRELRAKVQECFDHGVAQEMEQAFDLKEGTQWWRLSLKPFHYEGDKRAVQGVLITGLDITQKIMLQRALEVSTSRFRSVVDAAYDAIVTIDQQQHITLFNRAAESLFGYEQAEMISQHLDTLLPPSQRPSHGDYVHRFGQSPVSSRQMNERGLIYGQHRDGTRVPLEIAVSKINVGGGVEFTAIIRDITERVHLMKLLQKQATTDALTGLLNRREFTALATELMKNRKPFSILILDVDHFKLVNDTHGHDVGDEVLRLLSKVGAGTVRHRDLFARLGGEEFIAAMPDTDKTQALAMGERLRTVFERQDYDHVWKNGRPVPFTVSIGVATTMGGDIELEEMYKLADQALYRAKAAGRNRVEAAD